MSSRRSRRESITRLFFIFANELDGLSSSDMDDNGSIVATSPIENTSTQEESECSGVQFNRKWCN